MEQVNTISATLRTLVGQRQELVLQKRLIEKDIDDATEMIKEELNALGVDEAEVDDYKVVLSVRDRNTIDKTELISQGVTTEQIKNATKVSSYIQLDVRGKK